MNRFLCFIALLVAAASEYKTNLFAVIKLNLMCDLNEPSWRRPHELNANFFYCIIFTSLFSSLCHECHRRLFEYFFLRVFDLSRGMLRSSSSFTINEYRAARNYYITFLFCVLCDSQKKTGYFVFRWKNLNFRLNNKSKYWPLIFFIKIKFSIFNNTIINTMDIDANQVKVGQNSKRNRQQLPHHLLRL